MPEDGVVEPDVQSARGHAEFVLPGMTILTRSSAPSTTAVASTVSCMHFSPTQVPEKRDMASRRGRNRYLLNARRIEDRDHHVDEVVFGPVRGGGRFGGVVVAHQRQHAAVLRGAGEIGVTEHVAGAIDARALAVPDAEHAVVLALAAQFRLLGAPQRGGGKLLVDAGLERCCAGRGATRALELVVEPPSGEPR